MVVREQWGFRPEWLEFVKRTWLPVGRAQKCVDNPDAREFGERCLQSFADQGADCHELKLWVSVQLPERGSGYADSYPHFHYPLTGMCLVHYLEPGDKPAPLHIFEGDDVVDEIFPEAGMTVVMSNDVKHGVLKNSGSLPRIQMVAQVDPCPG